MKFNVTKYLKNKRKYRRIAELFSKYKQHDLVEQLFVKFMAKAVLFWIKDAVKKQRIGYRHMSSIYPPLSPKYKKRKKLENRNKFWINTGWLIDNLKMWKYKDWFIGYPTYIKYKNKRVKAGQVFLFLEKGTSKVPPRPLFSEALKWFDRNFDKLAIKFFENLEKYHK